MSEAIAPQLLIDAFQATLPWPLDPFQVEAIEKLEAHQGVLVSAPTSSGKTVIADYAVFRGLETNARTIYTTPLKALSNQKYRDYQRLHGEGYVGLVTGENTINPGAPVVVMTTEILRNLIYEDPRRLEQVRYVILDEVHYIDDFPRGAVWEEIIIQAPPHIKFVGLSATISNFQEVAEWMSLQRGDIATVSVTKRPVELRIWLAMRNEFYPLLDEQGGIPRETRQRAQAETATDYRLSQMRRPPENDLLPVVERLRSREFLPAIYFIFSRRGCREALARCAVHGFDLTTDAEKVQIDAAVRSRLEQIEDADEAALYRNLLDGQGARRRALPAWPDQGRLRHRDPLAGHPHAGASLRGLVLYEIRRPRLRAADLRRVDAVDGPGGAPRDRSHRPWRDPQGARHRHRHGLRGGYRRRDDGGKQVRPHLQHGAQPAPLPPAGRCRPADGALLRPVPESGGPPRTRRPAGKSTPASCRCGRQPLPRRGGAVLHRVHLQRLYAGRGGNRLPPGPDATVAAGALAPRPATSRRFDARGRRARARAAQGGVADLATQTQPASLPEVPL
ncbi:MAG: DEAD/DEAH box helicase [Chloroflexi bacterium]|nr:MAG: DEAD/DEAH box helicase [Chloroflexota bacterium]